MKLQFKTPIEIWLVALGILVMGMAIGASLTWLAGQQLRASAAAQSPQADPQAASAPAVDAGVQPELELLSPRASQTAAPEPVATANAAATVLTARPPPPGAAAVQPGSTRGPTLTNPTTAAAPRLSAAAHTPPPEETKPAMAARPAVADTSPSVSNLPKADAPPPSAPATAQTQVKDPSEQHIALAQAGIASLGGTEVRFASGRVVTIGEVFPSGEKLLSVDPGRQRIVTDKRTIVLH